MPAPFPGNPDIDESPDINTLCRSASGFIPSDLVPDQNGRIEFAVTIPPETENIFPPEGNDSNGFSCGPGDRCSIGFTFQFLADPVNFVFDNIGDVTSLAFTPKEPPAVEGCGAPREGRFVDAVGPSRLARSEVGWASQRCQGGKAQDLDYVVVDESAARDQFRDGQGDVFFGGGGVTEDEDPAAAGKRKSVPVPVALNAQVLAVIGGFGSQTPFFSDNGWRPTQLTDVRLTADQIADLLVRPDTALSRGPHTAAVLEANPQLAQLPQAEARESTVTILGFATPQVGHWIVSRDLTERAPAWRYPENFGTIAYERPGEPIGELWELSSLNPRTGSPTCCRRTVPSWAGRWTPSSVNARHAESV